MKHTIAFLLSMILIIACNEDGVREVEISHDSKFEKRFFKINAKEPENFSIKIINKNKSESTFRFVFNGNRIYGKIEDILEDIKKMPNEFPNEPIVRKVWRFTTDNSKHDHPLTDSAYYHIPQLFFNSAGFGYCDDRSMVNNFLWRVLGYESRVWGLANHVVSEVLVDNRWEMYDSMQEVYYQTKDGKIAGVQDIINDPDIVTNPIDPVIEFANDTPAAYTEEVLRCYLFPGIYSVEPVLPKIDFQPDIYLKDDFYIQFPFKYKRNLETAVVNNNKQKATKITDFTNLVYFISIPSSGIIPFPFFIHSIEGVGNVSFDQISSYKIGSKELEEKINKWDDYLFPVFFQSMDSIKINYLLNPNRFSMKEENTLIIYGDNIDSLDVQLVRNPD
jgi:hypothetical protein